MTAQPVEANVVLTADNTAYDQAMMQSAGSTVSLGKSIDTLGQKINNLSKSAGKKLLSITAADVALISGAVTAWASYEKQMSRLSAQSAILTRGWGTQERVMKDYTSAVKGLRTEYGTTTAEAAKLVETLSKVTNVRNTRQLTDLSKVFTDMSLATGESSAGLASSLTNLQKVMGAPTSTKATRQYADMFTYLGAQTNISTQGLIDFTSSIAPMGEAMGLNTKEVAGFATAFAKAGQEGIGATTVFNKVASDITKAIATGSPEIKQYANLIGTTAEQFKNLGGEEQLTRVFEALNKQGAQAVSTLERLGLEGTRNARAVQAVIREPGGVRFAQAQAEIGMGSDANARGAAEAVKGITDEFQKLGAEIKMMAEAMATVWGPALQKTLAGLEKITQNFREVVEGPMGEFLQMVMAVVGGLTSGVGAMLLFAGALLKVAAAFAVWRNSMSLGVREGFHGGAGIIRGPEGNFIARGGEDASLGPRGAQLARGLTEGRGSFVQHGLYNVGQPVGALLGGSAGAMREGWVKGRQWADPNYQPGPMRSPASYLAAGLGRAIEWGVTPQFDQMAHRDPSRRQTWAPSTLGKAMDWFRGSKTDILPEATERATKMSEVVKNIKAETEARLNSSKTTEAVTRVAITATQDQTESVKRSKVGFDVLERGLKGYAKGSALALMGGGITAADKLRQSPLAVPAAGALGMATMGMMGIQNNALMFGAMGATLGTPMTAAAGAGLGLMLDVSAGERGVPQRTAMARETLDSGRLGEMASQLKGVNEDAEKFKKYQSEGWWTQALVSLNGPSLFGELDLGPLQEGHRYEDAAKTREEIEKTAKAMRDLGEAQGVSISPDTNKQWKQFEEILITAQPAMDELGITMDDVVAASEKGGATWTSMLESLTAPGEATGLWDRLRAGGGVGAGIVDSAIGQEAIKHEGDIPLAFKAVNEFYDTAIKQGKTNLQIWKEAEEAQRTVGVEGAPESMLAGGVASKAAQALQLNAPQLGRVGAFREQLQVGQMFMGLPTEGLTATDVAEVEQQKTATVSAVGDQIMFLRQMLHAQDQYDIQRERAQEDYHQQRMWQEQEYNLSRQRAEENFARMRARAVADFHRQERRSTYEYNLQRKRAEEDFNHSVAVMSKQQAQSVYDIYSRVQTERTSSASWILSNAQDQLTRMQEQSANLDQLRARGMSDTAIQQLGLTSPEKAQQLASLMVELTPQMIRQFNKVAGTERIKAAKDIVTDPSSLEWQEMRRGFRRSMSQGAEDFERQMRQSRRDFKRGLNQQQEDFEIMMDQQAEDYATGIHHQEKLYKKSMDRSAEDMANMANEVLMSVEDVLTQSQERLTGAAGRQARQVAASLGELRRSTKPEAIALMTELAAIYGFEYTVPAAARGNSLTGHPGPGAGGQNAPDATGIGGMPSAVTGGALGMVVPGWTPGRDTRTIGVSGGEAVMRPEWTRAVGEKNIEAMNHKAIYGGYWMGGTIPLSNASVSQHMSGYSYPWAGDLNYPGYGDFGKPIVAWKSGVAHPFDYGSDRSYGRGQTVTHDGGQTTMYAHMSKVLTGLAGKQVRAGQTIGYVGDYGNTGDPPTSHLHFEIRNGSINLGDTDTGGPGLGRASGARFRDVMKKFYPESEDAAYGMEGVHPLNPGMISDVLNRYGRRAFRRMGRRYGVQAGSGLGEAGAPPAPGNLSSNQQFVRRAMTDMGWHQWNSLYQLVMGESGFDNNAQNPDTSAYGMFQFVDGTWPSYGIAKTSDPWKQSVAGMRYIKDRYGDPQGAWNFWQSQSPHWYQDGSVFTSPRTIGIGENGPEAVIPLNARGADFMADAMGSVMGGRNIQAAGGLTVYNTRIDRSTNFTGPITVQANNPGELLHKLRARQRVMALSRPSLTGSAA